MVLSGFKQKIANPWHSITKAPPDTLFWLHSHQLFYWHQLEYRCSIATCLDILRSGHGSHSCWEQENEINTKYRSVKTKLTWILWANKLEWPTPTPMLALSNNQRIERQECWTRFPECIPIYSAQTQVPQGVSDILFDICLTKFYQRKASSCVPSWWFQQTL